MISPVTLEARCTSALQPPPWFPSHRSRLPAHVSQSAYSTFLSKNKSHPSQAHSFRLVSFQYIFLPRSERTFQVRAESDQNKNAPVRKPKDISGSENKPQLSRVSNSGTDNSNCSSIRSWDLEGEIVCIGTGTDVECVIPSMDDNTKISGKLAARAVDIANVSTNQGMSTGVSNAQTATVDKLLDFSSTRSTDASSFATTNEASKLSEYKSLEMQFFNSANEQLSPSTAKGNSNLPKDILDLLVLISPFFFWGTSMVAMKGVLPKAGSLFVAATRLIPAGILLLAFATYRRRKQPSGFTAWVGIALFGLVDATFFQGFLAEGLKRTSAGLGSVIIDSQPLTVAVLATILFGESLGPLGALGLAMGVIGLLLLEVPFQSFEDFIRGHGLTGLSGSINLPNPSSEGNTWAIWDSGEWWMLLAAQSMAVGTVMVRWVSQYSDPVMATGWHMILGGLPLLTFSIIQHEPIFVGHIKDIQVEDWLALAYTSVFGSAISYGVFFYYATRGSLTKLSSLTFLTPMFAALFGYIFLDETLTPIQLLGALITLVSIYLVNMKAES